MLSTQRICACLAISACLFGCAGTDISGKYPPPDDADGDYDGADADGDLESFDAESADDDYVEECLPDSLWCVGDAAWGCSENGVPLVAEDCEVGCVQGVCLVGHAVSFPGNWEGLVTVADSSTLQIAHPNLTIELWLKGIADQQAQLISKGTWDDQSVNFVLSANCIAQEGRCVVGFAANEGSRQVQWSAEVPLSVSALNGWNHIAAVLDDDNQEARLYWNGAMGESTGLVPSWPAEIAAVTGTRLEIGTGYSATIDEVRISNIPRYYENYAPPSRQTADDYTMLLLHFDEGVGYRAEDASGESNDGVLWGAAQWSDGVR